MIYLSIIRLIKLASISNAVEINCQDVGWVAYLDEISMKSEPTSRQWVRIGADNILEC
jgi:hypothetical protein